MPKHRKSLPPGEWPLDVQEKLDASFADLAPSTRARLQQACGRWLKEAANEGEPPEKITNELFDRRTSAWPPSLQTAARQVVRVVWGVDLHHKPSKVAKQSERDRLGKVIESNGPRYPLLWWNVLAPKLWIDPDGLLDGEIVASFAPASILGRLQRGALFFDFCREKELFPDIAPGTVASYLDSRQARFKEGGISAATILIELDALRFLGRWTFPDRDWGWLTPAIKKLKKIVAQQPTRNNARRVDIAELRIMAVQAGRRAHEIHDNAIALRERTHALRLAHGALAIRLLVCSPIRVGSLAGVDLFRNFDPDFRVMCLMANETKDGKRDVRLLDEETRQMLLHYLRVHRAMVAQDEETALFVGSRGRPLATGYLSQVVGDITFKAFGRRVTPHPIRNSVASFIISQSPEEAGLAGAILNHSDDRSTETYRSEADQIVASRKLGEAVEKTHAAMAPRKLRRKKAYAPRTASAILKGRGKCAPTSKSGRVT